MKDLRDLNYLNSIYEDLDEGVGLKTTKLKKYYDNASGFESHKNPDTDHTELANSSANRRQVKYDYGKANYDVISADEAIRLVQQDKNNIQKLRIIYRLDDPKSLVEYEVRNNGTVYAIYGNPSREVTIGDKTYKNIRYAPWKKVLQTADLIYITDEYDRYLLADQEFVQSREDKKKITQLPLPADRTSPNFDPHADAAYRNMYHRGESGYRTAGRYVQHSVDTGAHDVSKRYHPTVQNMIQSYIALRKDVDFKYQRLDRYRRALKKLEREAEEIGEEEYLKKKERWESAYQAILSGYRAAVSDLKVEEAKLEKNIDAKSAAFAEMIRENISKYTAALSKGFALMQKIKDLKTRLTGDILTASDEWDFRNEARAVERSAESLRAAKKALEDALALMDENASDTTSSQEEAVLIAAQQFSDALSALDQLKSEKLERHIKVIDDIAKELRAVDAEIADLRPKAAAEKAARAAKNKAAELDPELVDILDFGEDEQDDQSTT